MARHMDWYRKFSKMQLPLKTKQIKTTQSSYFNTILTALWANTVSVNWNWVFIFLFVTQKKHTDCIHNFGDIKAWTFGIWRDSGTSTTLLHAQPLTRLLLRLMCSVETSLPFNNTLTWEQSAGCTIFCTSLNLPPLGEFFAERGCLVFRVHTPCRTGTACFLPRCTAAAETLSH